MTPQVPGRLGSATVAAFAGVVLFGGANAIAVRQTVMELAPFWSAAVRFLAAGLILCAIVLATGRRFPRGRSLAGALAYGVVAFAAFYAFLYPGLREAPADAAGVLLALTPLFTFGLAVAQRQERFRLQGLLGALVALGGIGLVFADQLGAHVPLGSLVLIVLGVACVAESAVIVRWIPRSDPFATNAVAMLTGGVLLLALSAMSGEARVIPTQTATWLALAYLVVFGSTVLFSLFVYVLQRWTASAVSYTTLLMPLVTVSLAALLTGEKISSWFAAGGAVILIGVYVGAFLTVPHRTSASSAPECLPIDACANAEGEAAAAAQAV
jgi:drug/metabolite transporter (DMT)-like permease